MLPSASRRTAGLAAVVAVAALALGACGPTTTPTATPPAPAAPATASAAPSPPPTSTTSAPAAADAAPSKCTTSDLAASLTRRPADPRYPDQSHAAVEWRNTSTRTCTMYGFGGVDLSGPDYRLPAAGDLGPTFSLTRSTEQPSTVRLEPGATALTEIPLLAPEPGPDTWTPTAAVVTPPDETHSRVLPWTFGPVVRQDAATRPGTFIDPVRAE